MDPVRLLLQRSSAALSSGATLRAVEEAREALILSRGDASTFITRPISATLLAIAVAVLIVVFLPSVRKKREEVFVEEA